MGQLLAVLRRWLLAHWPGRVLVVSNDPVVEAEAICIAERLLNEREGAKEAR